MNAVKMVTVAIHDNVGEGGELVVGDNHAWDEPRRVIAALPDFLICDESASHLKLHTLSRHVKKMVGMLITQHC